MSDTPQGPDWWQASDDKWYPPPRPEMPGDATTVAAPGATAPGDSAAPAGPPTAPAGAPATPPTGPPTAPGGPPMAPPGAYPQGPPSGGYPAGPPTGPPSGPYGAPSGPQPPGAPQQNRTPLYIAIGVVAVVALIGIVLVVTSGGDDDEPTSPTIDPPTTAEPGGEGGGGGGQTPATDGPETSAPSGDGTVELVDSGFSNFASGYDGDERSAAYGFVVENTGDDTATDVRISISAYDADDNALASDSQTIYVLRPGQRMGIGDEFYGENFASDVARIDVQVSEPNDSYFADDVPDEGELTAEGVSTSGDDYGLTTTFTAKSTYDVQVDNPSAYAIYRNSAGEIIGGSRGYLDFVPAGGTTAAEVTSYDLIPDVAETEVYIDPGYF